MHAVELAGLRLHVLAVHPGLPGEAARLERDLGRLDPAVVLADGDAEDARRLLRHLREPGRAYEPRFVDALYGERCAALFGAGAARDARPEPHPLAATARIAQRRRADLLFLRGERPPLGLFARRRARRAAAAVSAESPDALARAYADALAGARVWDAADDARASLERVDRARDSGRAPVALVVQAHRRDALLRALHAPPGVPA